jgi:Tol biopolymer transport system component/serine/threonine protein kinase
MVMTPERYKQIKSIFQSAVDLPRPEQAIFLDKACTGDEGLRREVEDLLSSHGRVKDSIEVIASEVAATMLAEPQSGSLIGQQIGAYQILDQIGRGGMGEVYLAQDARLGRKVALKLLPSQFVGDRRRVLRFEQEARAVSRLNHPNIVTIFDAGQVEDIYFIATEYIDGRTLRAELRERGRLPVREGLKIALQIADALSTAHVVGILHRDIKPENVMARRDGIVKVLDFGLAKVAESALPNPDTGASPPSNSFLSEAGAVFGTVKYMSPEQARGQEVDARTDVFSLGVMLYEMLTGRQPFAAAAIVDQIAKLLTTEPVPLMQIAPEIPTELQRVVQQALSKERDGRQRTIDEFARQLKQIEEELRFKDRLTVSGEAPAEVAGASRPTGRFSGLLSRRSLIAIGTVIIATLLGGPLAWRMMKSKPTPVRAASEFDPVRLTNDLASDTAPTWSPDGKQIAFTSNREGQPAIYVMNADGSGVRRIHNGLPVSNNATWQPDGRIRFGDDRYTYTMKPDGSEVVRLTSSGLLSPDGRQLLSQKELTPGDWSSTELFIANADGSNPRRLTHNKIADVNSTWSQDGKKITFTTLPGIDWIKGAICIINADGSGLARLTDQSLQSQFSSWSPDGTRIAFSVVGNPSAIYVMNADGRNQLKLTDIATGLLGHSWAPDGKKIAYATDYEGNFDIYVINSDPSHQTNLTHHMAEDMWPRWSPDGKKIAFISNREGKMSLYVMNPDGSEQRKVLNDVPGQEVSWSPDGKRFAFCRKVLDHYDIYLANADGGDVVRLLGSAANTGGSQWSPDGRSIVFTQDQDGYQQLYAIDLESRAMARLSNSQEHEFQHSFSPDGKQIVFTRSRDRGVQQDIWVMNSDGSNPRLVATAPGADEFAIPSFSPDGRRIAFQRRQNGQWDIWVMKPDGGGQTRLTFAAGGWPNWAPDGKRIAFMSQRRTGNAEIYVMDVSPTAGLQ